MKSATCECGHQEIGSTDKDVMNKMQSHMHNAHADRSSDMKKMMKDAEKTITEAEREEVEVAA